MSMEQPATASDALGRQDWKQSVDPDLFDADDYSAAAATARRTLPWLALTALVSLADLGLAVFRTLRAGGDLWPSADFEDPGLFVQGLLLLAFFAVCLAVSRHTLRVNNLARQPGATTLRIHIQRQWRLWAVPLAILFVTFFSIMTVIFAMLGREEGLW